MKTVEQDKDVSLIKVLVTWLIFMGILYMLISGTESGKRRITKVL